MLAVYGRPPIALRVQRLKFKGSTFKKDCHPELVSGSITDAEINSA